MIYRLLYRLALVCVLLCLPFVVSASESIDAGLIMQDSAGNNIVPSGLSSLGEPVGSDLGKIDAGSYPPSNLSSQDYAAIYAQASALLREGTEFRLCRLQVQTGDYPCPNLDGLTTNEAKLGSYYTDFNDGPLFDDHTQIRNKLLQARRLFASLYLVRNESQTFEVTGQVQLIKEQGLQGMLEATRELAYAHMIFGSEYAIDAFGYAFTIKGLAGSAVCDSALERYQQNLKRPFDPKDTYFTDLYFEDAECIIQNEIALLENSLAQYEMTIDVMISAYDDDLSWPLSLIIGQLFTQAEVQIFAVAVENYAAIVDELAIRYRQLGNDDQAVSLYSNTYDYLFLLTIPLLERADELHALAELESLTKPLLESNGLAIRAGLELMTGRLEDIEKGINVLGFSEDFVPIQSYAHMRDSATDLFEWAKTASNDAIDANRQFDVNAAALNTQMTNVQLTYRQELENLCGPEEKNDGFEDCIGSEGSQMEQSLFKLVHATVSMNLASLRIQSAKERIVDIQAQNDQEINVILATGEKIDAATLAQGMARAYQTTNSTSSSVSDEIYSDKSATIQKVTTPGLFTPVPDSLDNIVVGEPVETNVPGETVTKVKKYADEVGAAVGYAVAGPAGAQIGAKIGGEAEKLFTDFFGGTERTLIENETKGKRHSETKMSATTTVFNPSELEIADLQSVKDMASRMQNITISGIARDYEIRNLLRMIGEMQIEKEQAAIQYNLAVSEHNALVNRIQYLKAQYKRANNELNANYLANPAYRLLKDSTTQKASYQLLYAAKQAYLTARALEYHLADDILFINNVFKVRHPTHLQAYLHELKSLNKLGQTSAKTEVVFSLRALVTGIRDQDISILPDEERQALTSQRQEKFLAYMNDHVIENSGGNAEKLVLVFDTALGTRPLQNQDRKNWRIAGAYDGSDDQSENICPVRKGYGVKVEISQGRQTLPNGMTVRLVMSGQTSTRRADGQVVHYAPQLVTLLPDSKLSNAMRRRLANAAPDAVLDVNNAQSSVSDFCNMSVAASAWILEIPLADNQVDFTLFEDIKIKMQTFSYS